jgi:cytochrome bd-type quinol oxidase subunit 1
VFDRSRVPPWFYLFSTAMWHWAQRSPPSGIMFNNSWMQVPVGYATVNGEFALNDWATIILARPASRGRARGTCFAVSMLNGWSVPHRDEEYSTPAVPIAELEPGLP